MISQWLAHHFKLGTSEIPGQPEVLDVGALHCSRAAATDQGVHIIRSLLTEYHLVTNVIEYHEVIIDTRHNPEKTENPSCKGPLEFPPLSVTRVVCVHCAVCKTCQTNTNVSFGESHP